MKRIIICYHSQGESNSIASATMSQLEVNKIPELTVERLNVNKINIVKYLAKQKEVNHLPHVIYIYNEGKQFKQLQTSIQENFPEIHIEYYNTDLIYYPERIPGNKLKTKIYLLADRINYDFKYDYKKLDVYKVIKFDKAIQKTKKSAFDMFHPQGDSFNCYVDKKSAINKVKETLKISEDYYRHDIARLENSIKQRKIELDKTIKANSAILKNLESLD